MIFPGKHQSDHDFPCAAISRRVAAGAAFFGFLSKAKSENDLRQGGRIPGRFGPGSPKLLRRPRTDFPSLLPNNRLRSDETRRENKRFPAQSDSCRRRSELTRDAGTGRWSVRGCVRMGSVCRAFKAQFSQLPPVIPAMAGIPRLRLKRIVPVSNRPFYSKIPRPRGWGACISFPGPPRRGSRIPGRPGGEGCGGPGYGSPWS